MLIDQLFDIYYFSVPGIVLNQDGEGQPGAQAKTQ